MSPVDSSDSNTERTAALEEILDQLSCPNREVRFEAVETLCHLLDGTEIERTVPPLVETLGDESPRVRFKAAEALGRIASKSCFVPDPDTELLEEAVVALEETTADESVGVRGQSVTALGEFAQLESSFEEQIAKTAIERLDDEYSQVRMNSVDTLDKVSITLKHDEDTHLPLVKDISEAVAERLTDEDPDVRSRAESVLGRICEVGPEEQSVVISILLTLSNDEDVATRRAAVSALSGVETTATVKTEDFTGFRENLDRLIELLLDDDSNVREKAVPLFRGFADEEATLEVDVIEKIAEYTDAESSTARARAVSALSSLSYGSTENSERTFESVTAATEDPDPEVRERAVVALEQIGNSNTEFGKQAISAVSDVLNDPDPNVRKHAVRSLGDLGEIDLLNDIDSSVATKAINQLAEHRDEDSTVRLEAVATLGSLGRQDDVIQKERTRDELQKQAVEALGEYASDSDEDVRIEAINNTTEILSLNPAAASVVPIVPIVALETNADDPVASRAATTVLQNVAREAPSKFENVDVSTEEYLG
ncbi:MULTISPECIES: sister chromatid cohesion protein PDS5 [Haloarcula]|uniref:sister chromatid cohesion protein PDS5 n=1 Tax=Haloarcula TaxID=2237 RepID=UPI0023ED2978|nr:sister chromatid cohesion protein PDS5 [Halomicroarcula sp. XH51]